MDSASAFAHWQAEIALIQALYFIRPCYVPSCPSVFTFALPLALVGSVSTRWGNSPSGRALLERVRATCISPALVVVRSFLPPRGAWIILFFHS